MPYATMIAKAVFLLVGLGVASFQQGVGAYYHELSLREVCERRVEQRWLPVGAELDCSYPCLAAAIGSGPSQLGDYWLAYLPGGSLHV